MTQMLELTDKDFKAAMIDVLKDLKENVLIINRREIVKKQKQNYFKKLKGKL